MSTVLITGANRGIGLELARAYANRGDQVIGCCRRPDAAQELAAVDRVRVLELDVSDADSVARAGQKLAGEPVDVLLNNAGVMGPAPEKQTAREMDFDGWADAFAVNSMAPVRVMHALMENLKASSEPKVVTITSQLGALSLDMRMAYAYCASKAALNKFMKMAAVDLRDDGIRVCVIHPGWVRSDMGGEQADLSPAESAAGIVQVVDGLNAENSGSFWKWNGEEHDW